jgi:hypothetical protein
MDYIENQDKKRKMKTSPFLMVFSRLLAEVISSTPRLLGEGSLVNDDRFSVLGCHLLLVSLYIRIKDFLFV